MRASTGPTLPRCLARARSRTNAKTGNGLIALSKSSPMVLSRSVENAPRVNRFSTPTSATTITVAGCSAGKRYSGGPVIDPRKRGEEVLLVIRSVRDVIPGKASKSAPHTARATFVTK